MVDSFLSLVFVVYFEAAVTGKKYMHNDVH